MGFAVCCVQCGGRRWVAAPHPLEGGLTRHSRPAPIGLI